MPLKVWMFFDCKAFPAPHGCWDLQAQSEEWLFIALQERYGRDWQSALFLGLVPTVAAYNTVPDQYKMTPAQLHAFNTKGWVSVSQNHY